MGTGETTAALEARVRPSESSGRKGRRGGEGAPVESSSISKSSSSSTQLWRRMKVKRRCWAVMSEAE